MSLTHTDFHRLRVAEVRRETPDTVSVAFEVPAGLRDVFSFVPGQYLTLRAWFGGIEERRSYSICSGAQDGELRIAVKHVPGGAFSGHVNTALRPGDLVEVMPPMGRFGAAARQGVHVAIAAGSGITPILSIVKTILARDADSSVVLLYGSRSTAEIIFRAELDDLKDRHVSRLSVVHVLSREAQDIPVLNGRLDPTKVAALLPGMVAPGSVAQAFICGPADMTETLPAALQALGIPAERIQIERFAPSGQRVRPRPAVPVVNEPSFASATIIHDGKRREIPVGAGEAILDAALRAGLDLPWSCHGGMCSTCRARLVEGGADMEVNYALEPWETASGYVLTCQAKPTTKRLTVDYDQV